VNIILTYFNCSLFCLIRIYDMILGRGSVAPKWLGITGLHVPQHMPIPHSNLPSYNHKLATVHRDSPNGRNCYASNLSPTDDCPVCEDVELLILCYLCTSVLTDENHDNQRIIFINLHSLLKEKSRLMRSPSCLCVSVRDINF
jgi:hypothetical protein